MGFAECFARSPLLLMEGALGERLKREYRLSFDEQIAMAALIESELGCRALEQLWGGYMAVAARYGLPFLATTPTRRANRERMARAGKNGELIRKNVAFLCGVRERRAAGCEMYVGGLMGCRGDAYTGAEAMDTEEARFFHLWQARLFAEAGADFLYAGIMPTLPEALGMAQAMAETGLPYLLSFTIQGDGRLIDGSSIHEAIVRIDGGVSAPPVCYLSNCVHPAIVYEALSRPWNRTEAVRERFLGIQANTSPLPLAELDGAAELHSAEPEPFAADMSRLHREMGLKLFGGCCGTDDRHMEAVARMLIRGEESGPGDTCQAL